MDKNLIATNRINIQASPEMLWEVLTHPEKIAIYLYGTQVETDWKVGSAIIFKGDFNGVEYADKGIITKNIKNEILKYTYWSGFSGLEDKPENYSEVTYKIEKGNNNSINFTWHQQGFKDEKGKCHTENALSAMLYKIKELVEE